MNILHSTVLAEEVLEALAVKPGGFYIDCTLGDGGHAEAILERGGGTVLGLDRDPEAIAAAGRRLARFGNRIIIRNQNFSGMESAASSLAMARDADGIVMDLGLSTRQLLTPERGFGFSADGPLDMRMNQAAGQSARDIVNSLSREELTRIIKEYGEERRWAGRIAAHIVAEREKAPIEGTKRLAGIVARAVPAKFHGGRIHPATRTFQALRIAVNGELEELERALPRAVAALMPGGRLAVISFHSLEDRMVKRFFADGERGCVCPPEAPGCVCGKKPFLKRVTRKAVRPGPGEVQRNPRSRSARLRVVEKL